MAVLGELFGGYVPAPLAVDEARRWMLLADFGPAIDRGAPVEVREEVVRAFARLQVSATDRVDALLTAGCLDRRLP